MTFLELLKKEKPEYLPTSDIIQYIWDNFGNMKVFNDFQPTFFEKLVDITGTSEHELIHSVESMFPSVENHMLVYQEDQKIHGAFDLDFYGNNLANFRLQIFSDGLMARRRINRKQKFLFNAIKRRLPKIKFEYVAMVDALVWHDTEADLIITLRKVIQMVEGQLSSVSMAIMKREYSGLNQMAWRR